MFLLTATGLMLTATGLMFSLTATGLMLTATGLMFSLTATGLMLNDTGLMCAMQLRASCLIVIVDGYGPLFGGDAVLVLFIGGWYLVRW
jgi:hypothetical protein